MRAKTCTKSELLHSECVYYAHIESYHYLHSTVSTGRQNKVILPCIANHTHEIIIKKNHSI